MPITTLLAIHATDDSPDDLKPVTELAGQMGVHLNLVVFGALDTMPTATYPGLPYAYLAEEHSQVLEKAKQRAKTIEALVGHANLSVSVMVECVDRGMVAKTMTRHALCADLAVFPNRSIPRQAHLTDAFNGVLFEADRPVLVLGEDGRPAAAPKRVLMAWNGEPEAAAAIHQNVHLLQSIEEIHLVTVGEEEQAAVGGIEAEMSLFLARHGKEVKVDHLNEDTDDVSAVLMAHASRIDADMIVMGAYGHSRIRQWLLGGTTRDTLSSSRLPVFMAH
ncbi:universal stress protein [Hoeflea prorocentri]|uniref:Universal stress protein n=1 Tax=Hoeflea prorocentri TaxID=1922333 RepID=A0A9X3ZI81_9HYPH|nr:universal stress protein [Hoeflea prorocentri]MCY6382154.1 universal stress protein [Hoeflea prorocentri]MDA5399954.1 universal stress protein [Hoeflea prorocentri]